MRKIKKIFCKNRNKNLVIIGGSGKGKSRHITKPNFAENIHSEKDIYIFVKELLANISSDVNDNSGDDFWRETERILLSSILGYIIFECEDKDKNLDSVLELVNSSVTCEDDEDFVSPLDIMFQELSEKKPNCYACYMYNSFKYVCGSEETAKRVLLSLSVRLDSFVGRVSEDNLVIDGKKQ